MAVKNYYGSAAYDPAVQPRDPLSALVTEGHVKTLRSTKEVANGDSATSTINFGKISSGAMIRRNSGLYADAIAGNTDLDLGIGKDGVVKSANCLIDSWDGHASGVSNLSALDYADMVSKCAWQIAGYDEDPGGELDIIATTNAAFTAAGTLTLDLEFVTV